MPATQESAMADPVKPPHVQQFTAEWEKFVTNQVSQLETWLGELAKLETTGASHVLGAWEDAGRCARESLAQAERVTAEWRKLALEATRRTAQAVTAKA
jgi:hypothetical protein